MHNIKMILRVFKGNMKSYSKDALVIFEGTKIRRYWSDLKSNLSEEGFELYDKIVQLKQQNLRDHMNDLELIFNMLGEASTTKIARNKNAIILMNLKSRKSLGVRRITNEEARNLHMRR